MDDLDLQIMQMDVEPNVIDDDGPQDDDMGEVTSEFEMDKD